MNKLSLIWLIAVQLTVTVVTVYLLVKVIRSKKNKNDIENV